MNLLFLLTYFKLQEQSDIVPTIDRSNIFTSKFKLSWTIEGFCIYHHSVYSSEIIPV